MSKVVFKASCWDCQNFYIRKTKRTLHDRKTEHFTAITSSCRAIAHHVTSTGHNLKWDHFDILAKCRSDTHCKIKETLPIRELKPNPIMLAAKSFIFISLHLLICRFFSASVTVIVNQLLIFSLNLVVTSIPNGHF